MRSRSIPRRAFPNIKAVFALVTAGVEMDVLGVAFNEFDEQRRLGVVAAHPRGNHFKENIIDAFYHGMAHRPDSTFGTSAPSERLVKFFPCNLQPSSPASLAASPPIADQSSSSPP